MKISIKVINRLVENETDFLYYDTLNIFNLCAITCGTTQTRDEILKAYNQIRWDIYAISILESRESTLT